MATYNKFDCFVENLAEGIHDLDTHVLKVALTNSAPVASNTVFANITEIAAGNGYTAGGHTAAFVSSAQTAGTYKLVLDDVTITASGGSFGPFRYVVLYNDTPTSPADPLIAWWDYASSISVNAGESLLVDFSAANGVFTIT